MYAYNRTLRGNAHRIVGSARGLGYAFQAFQFTPENLLDMVETQCGMCYYSGVPMELTEPNSDWRMSLERLDNELGYVVANCVLIAAEFNTSDYSRNKATREVFGTAQWSREKVLAVPVLRNTIVDSSALGAATVEARGGSRRGGHQRKHYREENSAGEWRCIRCGVFKVSTDFQAHAGRICMVCTRECSYEYARTLRGGMLKILQNAKANAARRGQCCSLTLDELLDMLLMQGGRCYYSDVPLECVQLNSHWRMSLERLDNGLGYMRSNCAWVAAEFNTPDYSRNKPTFKVHGTAQWSRAKVAHVWSAQ